MNCSRSSEDAHAYVAGTRGPDALEAFELHLLSCSECRETVRLGSGSRAPLRNSSRLSLEAAVSGAPGEAPMGRALRRQLVAGGALLVAATAALIVVVPDGQSEHGLTAIVAPTFDPMPVRGADASAATAELIDRGMELFVEGDYAGAAARLAEAARADSTAGVSFFLGASQLLAGDPREALVALQRAWDEEGGPFEVDARLLGAKAWLRLGQSDSALTVLLSRDHLLGVERSPLLALADSIRATR